MKNFLKDQKVKLKNCIKGNMLHKFALKKVMNLIGNPTHREDPNNLEDHKSPNPNTPNKKVKMGLVSKRKDSQLYISFDSIFYF
jgi:hypothetical protein